MMLDLDRLRKKVREKMPDAVEVDVTGSDNDEGGSDYSCGDRAIAAVKHGDGEAFEEAMFDLFEKYMNKQK